MVATNATMSADDSFTITPNLEANISIRDDLKTTEVVVDESTALHRGLRARHTTMIGMFLLPRDFSLC